MEAKLLASALHHRLVVLVGPDPHTEIRVCGTAASKYSGQQKYPSRYQRGQHKQPKSHRLLSWDEVPEWQREDESYIETGYRETTPSILQCIGSWGYLHNESVNIFSHLFGAALFFMLPVVLYQELSIRYNNATAGDQVVLGLYLFSVAICFALSAGFHTLTSHSQEGCNLGIQLDFQGIILLMWSSTAPMVYYTFHGERSLQLIYWSISSFFALLASIVTFTPAFHQPATKPLRAGTFGALALSTLIGIIHGSVRHGWDEQSRRFPMWSIGLTLLFNTIGAVVYVLRFPEKYWRRKFDIFGASHQLMHCSIIVASLCLLAGMIGAFDNAHRLG